ncbi:unnamed protein product [Protopolystoma xenopodis]|uniref:Uncharacterized protein n=1 Tax=Protopolystoma xenopodis TaxID=117903 RepID=A0A448XT12_9PLAT|nr:unnamed protein product [Protopolystoma xenopodis]
MRPRGCAAAHPPDDRTRPNKRSATAKPTPTVAVRTAEDRMEQGLASRPPNTSLSELGTEEACSVTQTTASSSSSSSSSSSTSASPHPSSSSSNETDGRVSDEPHAD